MFVPGGLHDLQVWSEAICDGAWGRPGRKFGEWLRVKADMEDWSAFLTSFGTFVRLLQRTRRARRAPDAPATISVLSGDIHFSFAAEIQFSRPHEATSTVHQLVSSPIRNALKPPESTAMRLGTSRFADVIGRCPAPRSGSPTKSSRCRGESTSVRCSPTASVRSTFDGDTAHDSRPAGCDLTTETVDPELDTVIEFDLVAGSTRHIAMTVRSRSLQSPVGERGEAEDAVGGKPDAHHDHDDDAPRFGGQPAQRPVETGSLVRVVGDRRTQQEEADQAEPDAAADLADGAEPLDPRAAMLGMCPTCRARPPCRA